MKRKKPSYSLVPCDWCGTGLVEQCEKCGGSGSIAVVERNEIRAITKLALLAGLVGFSGCKCSSRPAYTNPTIFEMGRQMPGELHHESYLSSDFSCRGKVRVDAWAADGTHLVLGCIGGVLNQPPECRIRNHSNIPLGQYWADVEEQFPDLPLCRSRE